MPRPLALPLLGLLVLALACASTGSATPTPRAARPTATSGFVRAPALDDEVTRTELTAEDLWEGDSLAPVAEDAFAMPPEADSPRFTFEGELELSGEAQGGDFKLLRDDAGYGSDTRWQHLPEIQITLVQSGSHLIPAEEGLIYTGHVHWNLMVAPGRAWQEAGDGDYSRAALPFALIERNQNCVHNGVLMFLFDAATVSNVRYQITQETCLYFKFDMWGQLAATYTPGSVKNAQALLAAHAEWLAHRWPTKPLAALAEDYPEADLNLRQLNRGYTPEHLTTSGVFYNGVNYVGGCATRYGDYAFCDVMRLPSYSTAKSALAGVAYLRLGQLYDENVGDLLLTDYLPEAQAAGWDTVTLNHALDMTTGHYTRPDYMFDEVGDRIATQFILAEKHADKLTRALQYPTQVPPGQTWVYHSTDTYLATQAMYAYLREQTAPNADLFDLLVTDLFRPLHFSVGSQQSLRTENRATGRAMGSHGMFFTADDVAKLTAFLNVDHGRIDGEQILHPALLAATLQQDPADRGLQTSAGDFWYNNSFWAKDYTRPCAYTVVFMSGFGGVSIVMLPNGATYYAFSDNGEFDFDASVNEVQKLGDGCS